VKNFLIISLNLGKSFFANKTKELLLNARSVYFDKLSKRCYVWPESGKCSYVSTGSASAALPGLGFIFYDFIITISPEFSYPRICDVLKASIIASRPEVFQKRRCRSLPIFSESETLNFESANRKFVDLQDRHGRRFLKVPRISGVELEARK
jgi:hypothetical protein